MEHLCFNSANVTVLSLESVLSIYRLLCSSKISGQLWGTKPKYCVSKWLVRKLLYSAAGKEAIALPYR